MRQTQQQDCKLQTEDNTMHVWTQPVPSSLVDSAFNASDMSPSDTSAASRNTDRKASTKLLSIQPMAYIQTRVTSYEVSKGAKFIRESHTDVLLHRHKHFILVDDSSQTQVDNMQCRQS